MAKASATPCLPKYELIANLGWKVLGECGAVAEHEKKDAAGRVLEVVAEVKTRCRCTFTPNQVVDDGCFSPKACADFRARVLAVFGPGGTRVLFGHGSKAEEGDSTYVLKTHERLPEGLELPSEGPGLTARLVEGLRTMFGGRPSESFRKYAKSVEDDRAAQPPEETKK